MTLEPRVLLLIHNPVIEQFAGRRLREVIGWNDPDWLCGQCIFDLAQVSRGRVNYRIVERIELDEWPVKQDGFRYDDAAYINNWRAARGWHQPDTVDYPALLASCDFVRKLEAGRVDELWLMGFPYAGYYESCMGGRGAIWCNGPVIPGAERVSRRFVVMGFNYERGVGEMLEDFGHRAESILEHVFARAPRVPPPGDPAPSLRAGGWLSRLIDDARKGAAGADGWGTLWEHFTRHDRAAPGRAACGNVHFAPNSERDYDWGNRRAVASTADDWLDYPRLTGRARPMHCADWGNGDIRAHHKWWFERFPRADGQTDYGVLHDWWRYVIGLEY